MSSMPSLFRSVVRGEDCDPITGKSFNQITSVGFFEEVSEQPENITTTIIAIAPAVEKNWILTKEILLDKNDFYFSCENGLSAISWTAGSTNF